MVEHLLQLSSPDTFATRSRLYLMDNGLLKIVNWLG
jgi:hypothetical protein